jgi:hypothetical protein
MQPLCDSTHTRVTDTFMKGIPASLLLLGVIGDFVLGTLRTNFCEAIMRCTFFTWCLLTPLCALQFNNNTALADGGALILDGMTGDAMIYNNTASGNQAIGGRGGFAVLAQTMSSCASCVVRVVHSKFTSNTAGAPVCGVCVVCSRADVPVLMTCSQLISCGLDQC